MPRGPFAFEVADDGGLLNSSRNVEALRRLWLDRDLADVDNIGPGDRGDFAAGAWHVGCHLAGAGGVRRLADGRIAWLEIVHDPRRDCYFAGATVSDSGQRVTTIPLDSAEGRTLLQKSTLLGFVEGNSTGRISARGVFDSTTQFNLWRRQDFDQPVGAAGDGGRVWEHWVTLRDISPASEMGSCVLAAYVSLASALGDLFAPTVARGRKEYGHPVQLAALVFAGFCSEASATWDTTPLPLSAAQAKLLEAGAPDSALEAVSSMEWDKRPRYYMYKRRIGHWCPAASVRAEITKFRTAHPM
jgi:hypothetical protein